MNKTKHVQTSNKEVAHLLRSVAAAYIIKGEIRFKIIAYENAADAVEHLNREIYDIFREGSLAKVNGIGPSIASHLDEYFRTGSSSYFDRVFAKIPKSVFELMRVPSIGPKKAYKLVQAFHLIDTKQVFKDVMVVCREGKVAKLEGFGEKSQDAILKAITEYLRSSLHKERMPLPYAYALGAEIIEYLKKNKHVVRADLLGSLRRMTSTIGDIDIAVQIKNSEIKVKSAYEEVIKHFIDFPKKISVDNAGQKKASIIVEPNIRVDLRIQEADGYGAMLQYFTGSKEHNISVREHAIRKGYSVSEWGIKRAQSDDLTVKKFSDEKSFYKFLGLDYVEPEMREGQDEVELAAKGKLPRLLEKTDIKGDLHLHSSYDLKPSHDFGKNSYREIAEYAKKLKYEYVGFTDHNPRMSNLSPQDIVSIMRKRKEHIDKSLRSIKIGYFIGLEVDILPDGRLALPDEAFAYVDYLLISVHSAFSVNPKEQTKRVIRAMSKPKVKIFGHPTGRLLGKRTGYELEWDKIFSEARKQDIALEINAWPQRLDLPDTLVRKARDTGVKLAINTDSHANHQMNNMFYGISVARRGWCTKHDIMNTRTYREFERWIK